MHTKINNKKRHKSRHVDKPRFEKYRYWKPKICQNGHKFWVQAYTTIKYNQRHQKFRPEQPSDRIPNFQAHGANINIFVARNRTEFHLSTLLCPPNHITKCAHKNNFSTPPNNTTNRSGQIWALILVKKLSSISNVIYLTHSRN